MKDRLEDMLIQGAYFLVLTAGLLTVGYMQAHAHNKYPEIKTEKQNSHYIDREYKK